MLKISEELKHKGYETDLVLLNSFESLRIATKSSWLEQNLSINLNIMYTDDENRGGIIEGVNLLGDDSTGEREVFSIGLYRPNSGIWTAVCPEIIGCVAQGNTKKEAMQNLCLTLSECVVLNYDILKINPFTTGAHFSNVDIKNDTNHYSPYDVLDALKNAHEMNYAYLTTQNIILKTEKNSKITITVPCQIMSPLTKYLILKLAEESI